MNEVRSDTDGFTILEVLVALAILSISLATILGVISRGLHETELAQAEASGTALARSLLDESRAQTTLTDGDSAGQTASGYHWRMHIAPYGAKEDRQSWTMDPRQVSVLVSWKDGVRERAVSLTTLVLLPKEQP